MRVRSNEFGVAPWRRASTTVCALLLFAAPALDAQPCPKGRTESTLGIVVHCTNCVAKKSGETIAWMHYTSPPVVAAIEPGARLSISLRKGDVITAIDTEDIRTERGSRLFSAPDPDRPVRLAVRRGGSEIAVTVRPVKGCAPRKHD